MNKEQDAGILLAIEAAEKQRQEEAEAEKVRKEKAGRKAKADRAAKESITPDAEEALQTPPERPKTPREVKPNEYQRRRTEP